MKKRQTFSPWSFPSTFGASKAIGALLCNIRYLIVIVEPFHLHSHVNKSFSKDLYEIVKNMQGCTQCAQHTPRTPVYTMHQHPGVHHAPAPWCPRCTSTRCTPCTSTPVHTMRKHRRVHHLPVPGYTLQVHPGTPCTSPLVYTMHQHLDEP